MASMTAQTKINRKILTMLLRSVTISIQAARQTTVIHEPARPGLHMRYWRYHSKHVLRNAFDLVGVVGRAGGSPTGRNSDRTKRLWQAGLLYPIRIPKNPRSADRAPRPVGQCDASPRDRQLLGCRRAGSQRRAIRTVGTRSR